ncbi:hypothetical protein K2173_026349 [Erythroxylum novogranatense]|uniref:Calmodulin-binding protein n=1 Tax=Erythroxylum novogranatense TaxID=1862640 RepID=A0AAV8SN96_9ROSI|nr:hypothetical protein K2173_026349 [Erythroxylum novogranatense]
MAAKRFIDESDDQNPDQPNEKRRRISFASVIQEAVMVNSLKKLFMSLEPMLRKVVSEEVEGTLQRCSSSFTRSPSLRIQELEQSSLQLVFNKKLSLPIFTGSKIVDAETNASLQVLLVQTGGDHMVLTSLPHPIKLEIVVLDGDFPSNDRYIWTSEEFENKIVKERTGKRPLLAGDCLTVTLKDGVAPIGDIEFTDNSSWIRSRKFRIGAKVVPGSYQGLRIREAMTEAFVVKDHRGELYKKHHPPLLEDQVWRLEKIGKGGAFHKKLAAEGINTVQDFLKLSTVDPQKLRKILGVGMSEKMWEVAIKHARTCLLGNKRYVLRGATYTITFNPVCQVVDAIIDGQTFTLRDLSSIDRTYIKDLITKAYHEWHSLEEVVAISSDETPLLTQGNPNPFLIGSLLCLIKFKKLWNCD